MSLSQDLLDHASDLLHPQADDRRYPSEVKIRRAISAAYYALFHAINQDAVGLIAPNVSRAINHRIQRWFDYAEMKRVCGRFTQAQLDQPLRDLIGDSASSDLQRVARDFIQLQNARHSADYDLSLEFTPNQGYETVVMAEVAIEAWNRLKGSSEANIFILSLLLWKNWERER